MKTLKFSTLLIFVFFCSLTVRAQDKMALFQILAGHSVADLDKAIARLETEKDADGNAYLGAMLMKKAQFVKGAGIKVKTFKRGAGLLEAEIQNDPMKTEYRFLRLTVQEHAPGILKYNKHIEQDKKAVMDGFTRLDAGLRKIVVNYAGNSGIIKPEDLK